MSARTSARVGPLHKWPDASEALFSRTGLSTLSAKSHKHRLLQWKQAMIETLPWRNRRRARIVLFD